jgi:hypothetical protein
MAKLDQDYETSIVVEMYINSSYNVSVYLNFSCSVEVDPNFISSVAMYFFRIMMYVKLIYGKRTNLYGWMIRRALATLAHQNLNPRFYLWCLIKAEYFSMGGDILIYSEAFVVTSSI